MMDAAVSGGGEAVQIGVVPCGLLLACVDAFWGYSRPFETA